MRSRRSCRAAARRSWRSASARRLGLPGCGDGHARGLEFCHAGMGASHPQRGRLAGLLLFAGRRHVAWSFSRRQRCDLRGKFACSGLVKVSEELVSELPAGACLGYTMSCPELFGQAHLGLIHAARRWGAVGRDACAVGPRRPRSDAGAGRDRPSVVRRIPAGGRPTVDDLGRTAPERGHAGVPPASGPLPPIRRSEVRPTPPATIWTRSPQHSPGMRDGPRGCCR